MSWGLPYNGSKQGIAEEIVSAFPSAPVLVDAFCGGGAISHCALCSGKFGKVLANDIEPNLPQLLKGCLDGSFRMPRRWVPREELLKRLNGTELEDVAISLCWSFNSLRDGYFCSENLEAYEKALWDARVEGDLSGFTGRSVAVSTGSRREMATKLQAVLEAFPEAKRKGGEGYSDSCFLSLAPLAHIARLEGLKAKNPEALETSNLPYDQVPIPDGALVYCDIPYENTREYKCGAFDKRKFERWCLDSPYLIVVSEYSMSEDFEEVAAFDKFSSFKGESTKEKLFVVKDRVQEWRERTKPALDSFLR